jgi:hypothetical protein
LRWRQHADVIWTRDSDLINYIHVSAIGSEQLNGIPNVNVLQTPEEPISVTRKTDVAFVPWRSSSSDSGKRGEVGRLIHCHMFEKVNAPVEEFSIPIAGSTLTPL